MPPKKKKTQLKQINRGFATTSQPKKPVQNIDAPEAALSTNDSELADQPSQSSVQVAADAGNVHSESSSPEEKALQELVDKLQEKTEKEIVRYIKALDVDRRFSQTLPRLELEETLRDRIIDEASMSDIRVNRVSDDKEKAISRLGVTFGVLRRLGYRGDTVETCLRDLEGVELDEAFEWIYLRCSEAELTSDSFDELRASRSCAGVTIRRHFTPPATPAMASGPLPSVKPGEGSSKSVQKASSPNLTEPPVSINGAAVTIPTLLVLYEHILKDLKVFEDLDPSDPTQAFVRLKLLHDIAIAESSSRTSDYLRVIRTQMDISSKDYLFSEKEAKAVYQKTKKDLDRALLKSKLRSTPIQSEPTKAPVATSRPKPQATPTPTPSGEDSDSDESIGMLGILDDPNATEVTIKGVTIPLRHMALPKHWSGPMPKSLLRDFVSKQDRYAAVSYAMVSTHSRARRATVVISWQNKKRDEWVMDDMACPDDAQAENYVATIALHSLTYPVTEGFASSAAVSSGSATSFRLLPAVYRDLWEELEHIRKADQDTKNRQNWAKLKLILDEKAALKKSSEKQVKQAVGKRPAQMPSSTSENITAFHSLALTYQVRQATSVYQSILIQRNGLPISKYRADITDLLERSQVLVLSGETGCGKSTQVPSFILEDHLARGKPCKIICTEPRRISAISLAQRVAYELCDPPNSMGGPNSLIGYSIRLESNISRTTRLAFVTNGIALRMLENGSGQGGQGTAFDDITHIVVDEVHERSIESDFLLIVLKTLMIERPDLKVILMSATLDAEKISAYFDNCPTLHVPGRTFPVTVQYLEDAIEYTKWTVTESSPYARRLSDRFYKGKTRPEWSEDTQIVEDDDDDPASKSDTNVKLEKRYSPETASSINMFDERLIPYDLIIRLLEKLCFEDPAYHSYSAAILVFMPGLGEIRRLNDILVEHTQFGSPDFKLHPLHSTLSSESQGAVFDIPPQGIRKIVIATNIAETGITIPDITSVIDTGKHREMRFDEKRQISRLVETYVAKSNAAQRRGRAGRVQQGLCYHLFTKLRHETQMAESPLPEMLRLSLSDLALRIKIMNVKLGSSIGDVLSRALDPPIALNVQRAVSMLVEVRALTLSEDITPMGRLLSKLPTDVHLGKFLLVATVFRCLDPALTIAATLNSKSPFVAPLGLEHDADRAKATFRIENSDFLTIHNAFASWRRACANPGFARKFCHQNFLSHQNLQQIEDLRQQFLGYLIDSSFIQVDKSLQRELGRTRYGRNKPRFVTVPQELDANSNNPLIIHAALAAGLYPKILSVNPNGEMRTITNNQHAYFHPSSINFGKNALDFATNYLSFFTLMHSKKLYAWETGPVDELALVLLCGDAEHKLSAEMLSIDRKTRFYVSPKTNLALKILREQIAGFLSQQYQGKPLTQSQQTWKEIAQIVLGHIKIKTESDNVLLSR